MATHSCTQLWVLCMHPRQQAAWRAVARPTAPWHKPTLPAHPTGSALHPDPEGSSAGAQEQPACNGHSMPPSQTSPVCGWPPNSQHIACGSSSQQFFSASWKTLPVPWHRVLAPMSWHLMPTRGRQVHSQAATASATSHQAELSSLQQQQRISAAAPPFTTARAAQIVAASGFSQPSPSPLTLSKLIAELSTLPEAEDFLVRMFLLL